MAATLSYDRLRSIVIATAANLPDHRTRPSRKYEIADACLGVFAEDHHRLAALHQQRLIRLQLFQGAQDGVETLPVARRAAAAAVDDQTCSGVAHQDLMPIEVDVLDAQLHALADAHAGPVEQLRHQLLHPRHLVQNATDFVSGEDGGQMLRLSGADGLDFQTDGVIHLFEQLLGSRFCAHFCT